jgi:ribosomal protein S15
MVGRFLSLSALLILLNGSNGFIAPFQARISSQNTFKMSSSLAGFDGSSSDSPLVDRALDSALDFLQDVEGPIEEEDEDDEFDIFEIYEDSPDIEINYDLIAEIEKNEADALANKLPSKSEINAGVIKAAIEKWRKHDNDCGSAEVQIAITNERIKYLTVHMLKNKHDVAAKRGLDQLVQDRKKFLNYLYGFDPEKAIAMAKEMGIRFRPPGRLWDKQSKYESHKNTKTKFKVQKKRSVKN